MSIRFPIRSLIAGCLAMALPAAAADHISIAATLPLTGTESRSGLQYREGYDLAFALANAKGGLRVGGKQYLVDLRAVDDASDPAKAGSLLEAYVVRDHVNLLLSSYSTRLVESQSTVAEKHHVPLVIGGASSKSLFRRGYHYAFGLQASVEQLAFAEMRFVEEQQKAGKLPAKVRIALLWEDTAHGRDYRDSVLEYVRKTPARQAAYEIALNEGFALDQKSYRKLLDNVKAGNVDVFLASGTIAIPRPTRLSATRRRARSSPPSRRPDPSSRARSARPSLRWRCPASFPEASSPSLRQTATKRRGLSSSCRTSPTARWPRSIPGLWRRGREPCAPARRARPPVSTDPAAVC